MGQKFKWTIEIEVDEVWVADGFDMTDERALQMLGEHLPYANMTYELKARVIGFPDPDLVARTQGYRDAVEMDLAKAP